MNILLVCPYFPPENTIAAVRIGKFAEHLAEGGDSVRVVTRFPADHGQQRVERDGVDVAVLRSRDPILRLRALVRRKGGGGLGSAPIDQVDTRLTHGVALRGLHRVAALIRSLFFVPDPLIFWVPGALSARRLRGWRPDIVVASGGPVSSFIVGSWFARQYGVPWVADYRDLLSSGPYYERGRIRRGVDKWIERRVVSSASALTTVSSPLVDDLEVFLRRRAEVVLNGFDPQDFEGLEPRVDNPQPLTIIYCGEIYPVKRDPSNLFIAARELTDAGLVIEIRFYGANVSQVSSLAAKYGVNEQVRCFPRVSHAESLRLQTAADVLLLLLWNDPREAGVYTGKLFEYIGARRPILLMGYEGGVAADLVRERRVGVIANGPSDIAAALRQWSLIKAVRGSIEPLPVSGLHGLTRQDQARALRRLLVRTLASENVPRR